jgi:hypothetical protein
VEYVQYQYTSGYFRLLSYLRRLPREESRLTSVGLALVALLLLATAASVAMAPALARIAFEDVTGTMQSVPVVAVVLSVAAFAVAWACLLAGSAAGPGILWMIAGLLWVYSLVVIGLAHGRSWLHLVPLGLPLAVGALTPGSRPWANVGLTLVIASVTIRLSPFPAAWRAMWYLPWLPLAAALLWLQAAAARRAHLSAVRRTVVVAGALLAYLCAVGVLANPRQVVEGFHVSLNNAIGFLELLWFLLGASFIAGAIALGQFAQKAIGLATSARTTPWLLPVAWLIVVIWIVGVPFQPAWAHALGLALVGVFAIALVVRRSTRGLDSEWLAGWFVTSIGTLGALRAYTALDLGEVVTRDAGLISLVAFVYAVVWEVAGRIPDVPSETRHFMRPAPLLLALGIVLIMGAAALFGFAANLKFFQQVVVLAQYRGALILCIPVAVLTLVDSRAIVPADARRRFGEAFVIGAIVGIPVFALRAVLGAEVANWGAVAGAAWLAIWLTRHWPQAATRLGAAGVAGAASFGLTVSVASRAIVILVPPLLTMAAALGGPSQLRHAAETIAGWTSSTGWSPRDQVFNFLVAPLSAVAVAIGTATVRSRSALPAFSGGQP